MEKLTTSSLKTKLTSIANANSQEGLHTVFVNTVYQALVMGNVMPEHMLAIRHSSAPAAFKAALGKYCPVTYNKGKDAYEYSRTKAEVLRTTLGVELASDKHVATIDEVAAKLPALFEKAAHIPAEFNLTDYCANVGKKLNKEGVSHAEAITQVLEALTRHPELVDGVANTLFAGATVKAA